MGVVELTKDNFEEEVLAAKVPVLIDFWAEWCGPCKMQSPIVDEAAEELAGKAKVCKVNVDEQSSLAMRYQVRNIPTLLLFKDGQEKERLVGVQSKEDLSSLLDSYR